MILPLPPELSQLLTPFNYFLMLVGAILIPTIVTLDTLFSKRAKPLIVTVEVPTTIQQQTTAAAPVIPASLTDPHLISSKAMRKKQQRLTPTQNNEKTIDQVLGEEA